MDDRKIRGKRKFCDVVLRPDERARRVQRHPEVPRFPFRGSRGRRGEHLGALEERRRARVARRRGVPERRDEQRRGCDDERCARRHDAPGDGDLLRRVPRGLAGRCDLRRLARQDEHAYPASGVRSGRRKLHAGRRHHRPRRGRRRSEPFWLLPGERSRGIVGQRTVGRIREYDGVQRWLWSRLPHRWKRSELRLGQIHSNEVRPAAAPHPTGLIRFCKHRRPAHGDEVRGDGNSRDCAAIPAWQVRGNVPTGDVAEPRVRGGRYLDGLGHGWRRGSVRGPIRVGAERSRRVGAGVRRAEPNVEVPSAALSKLEKADGTSVYGSVSISPSSETTFSAGAYTTTFRVTATGKVGMFTASK